jgi:hypothetical protein
METTPIYEAPELTELGTLSDLTEGSTTAVIDNTFVGANSI